jgi:hypothetical protein
MASASISPSSSVSKSVSPSVSRSVSPSLSPSSSISRSISPSTSLSPSSSASPINLIYPPTQNGIQKTLGAELAVGYTASATFSNTTGIQNMKGLFLVDRIDTTGAEKDPSVREYVTFTGVSGSTVTGLERGLGGTTDQTHAVGAVVEFVMDVVQMQSFLDAYLHEHSTAGRHTSDLVTTLKATGAQVTTGTSDVTIVTPKAVTDSNIVTTTGAQALTNKTLTNPLVNASYHTVTASTPAGGATQDLDLDTVSVFKVTMPAGNLTLTVSNENVGQFFIVEVVNATSQGTLTWFSTITWAGGSAPTLTGTNGKKDTFGFRVTGTDTYDGYIIGQNV